MDGFRLALWIREAYPTMPVFLASREIGKARTSYELAPAQPFFLNPYDMDIIVAGYAKRSYSGLCRSLMSSDGRLQPFRRLY
jgi:hypothetical protein